MEKNVNVSYTDYDEENNICYYMNNRNKEFYVNFVGIELIYHKYHGFFSSRTALNIHLEKS